MKTIKNKILEILKYDKNLKIPLLEIKIFLESVVEEDWHLLEQEEIFLRLSEIGFSTDSEYDLVKNKVNALKTFLMNDSFYFDIDIFQKIILGLNDDYVIQDMFQELGLSDIIYVFSELKNSYDFDPSFLSNDINAYIASIAKEDGFIIVPNILKSSQKNLDKLNGEWALSFKDNIKNRFKIPSEELYEDDIIDQQVLKLRRLNESVLTKNTIDGDIDGI